MILSISYTGLARYTISFYTPPIYYGLRCRGAALQAIFRCEAPGSFMIAWGSHRPQRIRLYLRVGNREYGKRLQYYPMILVHLALFFAVLPRRVVSPFLFYT